MQRYTVEIAHTGAKFTMVPIPGGEFFMGSPAAEPRRRDDEGPQHRVRVEPFWMGEREVTWDEYEPFMLCLDIRRRQLQRAEPDTREQAADAVARPTKPYTDMTFGMGKRGYPAICMTQLAARMYCRWLSVKTGDYYRLPTEAEWEYACRAGSNTAYHFGDDASQLDEYAWHRDNSDYTYHKVGQKKPNPWGLYDMHGNVAEWVLDQYSKNHYAQFRDRLARQTLAIPKDLYPRVVRGGSWDDAAADLRSAARAASTEDWKAQDPQLPQSIWYHTDALHVGFRVVRPLREPGDQEKAEYWDAGTPMPAELPPEKLGCNHE
ncbi:MAG: formylglycine-generating enzyme family protein [Planctomycetota bacterium]|nr:MAG: formylglycine-generating enzyme family protein [Planctomycetota bacterium]REJ86980.1 MAG: formylglycine-generating enzyme family protein [Planctomycetota bacterium]REK24961.1 MAG: formylglycine-generating enzyme family protein [Planctomycetota bacterium]REK48548.1 MAG: formylglycine-generating enzyme family protein [Planctomycetota bacterium]